mmetsp:Transcript_51764/g.128810  ORF Transcript_51764/g.128810 Transcript_51764/m.128810 type:complete len:202 (-) Transcript_51764:538-1143(-)
MRHQGQPACGVECGVGQALHSPLVPLRGVPRGPLRHPQHIHLLGGPHSDGGAAARGYHDPLQGRRTAQGAAPRPPGLGVWHLVAHPQHPRVGQQGQDGHGVERRPHEAGRRQAVPGAPGARGQGAGHERGRGEGGVCLSLRRRHRQDVDGRQPGPKVLHRPGAQGGAGVHGLRPRAGGVRGGVRVARPDRRPAGAAGRLRL